MASAPEQYFAKTFIESEKSARVNAGIGGLMYGCQYDKGTVSFPSNITEQYDFYLANVLQRTIVLTYSDSTKMQMVGFEKTFSI